MKERDLMETNVEKNLAKLNCFRRYSILKCTYVSKNSKNWLEIQKSKRNISLTNGAFQKKVSLSILSHRAFLKIIYMFCHILEF